MSLVMARCQATATGSTRWNLRFDSSLRPDVTIAVRLEPDNQTVRDYYLFPGTLPTYLGLVKPLVVAPIREGKFLDRAIRLNILKERNELEVRCILVYRRRGVHLQQAGQPTIQRRRALHDIESPVERG
jgi:hypothetical protein